MHVIFFLITNQTNTETMAYFSNSAAGMAFDSQCQKCRFGNEACPIALAQTVYNYDACGNDVATSILNTLVKDDGSCEMYKAFEDVFSIPSQLEVQLFEQESLKQKVESLHGESKKCVFFHNQGGKYITEGGAEITSDLLVKHPHYITSEVSYIVIDE